MDSTSLGRIENALNNMVRQIAGRIQQVSLPEHPSLFAMAH